MSYISNSDIELRLGTRVFVQLTDDEGLGSPNIQVADEARLGAEGEVDSYLARRFQVPIDVGAHPEVAAVLATVTLDIAEYRLHARREPVPDGVIARYRAALHWLAQVAAGRIALPSAGVLEGGTATGISGASVGNPALLSRQELEGL
jgi:phage gp36-like protein